MSEKAINFFKGKICIRNEDKTLSFEDDSCIPILKQRIDKYIKDHPTVFSTKKIIFTILKDYFKIYKTFITPCSDSCIPHNDPLYNELLCYISNNPTFSNRLNKHINMNMQRKKDYINNVEKTNKYYNYLRDKNNYFLKQRTTYGKRG